MEHIQRATIQLQVVVNGKRKLEQTATSYTAPRHAFRSCLSCGHHTGLFLPLPAPPHQQAQQMQIASASDPSLAKCGDDHHTVFLQESLQCQLFTAPQFWSHKRLQFESCLAQVQLGRSW